MYLKTLASAGNCYPSVCNSKIKFCCWGPQSYWTPNISKTACKNRPVLGVQHQTNMIARITSWWLNHPFEKYARQNGFIFPSENLKTWVATTQMIIFPLNQIHRWSFPPTAWRAACGSTAPRSFAHGSIAGVSKSDACRPCRNARLAASRSRGRVCWHQGCNTENTLQHKFQAHKMLISEFRTHWYPLDCWWPL